MNTTHNTNHSPMTSNLRALAYGLGKSDSRNYLCMDPTGRTSQLCRCKGLLTDADAQVLAAEYLSGWASLGYIIPAMLPIPPVALSY